MCVEHFAGDSGRGTVPCSDQGVGLNKHSVSRAEGVLSAGRGCGGDGVYGVRSDQVGRIVTAHVHALELEHYPEHQSEGCGRLAARRQP